MPIQTGATIFDYCERGANPAFWAEPLNAVTNGGFIVAGLAGVVLSMRRPSSGRSLWYWFFILNFMAIGIGSFLFHTVPNVTTVQADTIPIGIFMIAYLTFAMKRFVRLSWFLTAAGIAAFIGAMIASLNVQCWNGRFGFLDNVPPGAQAKCLNGSLGYAPALIAMWAIAGWLMMKRHPAAPLVFAAGATFIISLTFRSVDFSLCNDIILCGRKAGTHFVWHLLNSLTLFLLLLAGIKYGGHRQEVLPPRPKASQDRYAFQ